jgi:hypothetical protein
MKRIKIDNNLKCLLWYQFRCKVEDQVFYQIGYQVDIIVYNRIQLPISNKVWHQTRRTILLQTRHLQSIQNCP